MKEKGKKYFALAIYLLISVFFLWLALLIDYPPYPEELNRLIYAKNSTLINNFGNSTAEFLVNLLGKTDFQLLKLFPLRTWLQQISRLNSLFSLRIINFLLINAGLAFFYKTTKQAGFLTAAWPAIILIIASPLFFSLWLFHPSSSLTFFLCLAWVYFFLNSSSAYGRIFASLILIAFSSFPGLIMGLLLGFLTLINFLKEKKYLPVLICLFFVILVLNRLNQPAIKTQFTATPILNALNFPRAQQEINERIINEDNLYEKISFPLWFRRLGYNKYFFAYRNLSKEMLNFFDLETLFFQEVHPQQQKAEVIFYWPSFFLFGWGFFILSQKKVTSQQLKLLSILFFMALVYYLFQAQGNQSQRLLFSLPLLALITAFGWQSLGKKIRITAGLIFFLAIFININDIKARPLFWFDNRPYAYSQGILALKHTGLEDYQNIYLTSLIGNPKIYYYYYFQPSIKMFDQGSVLKNREQTIYWGNWSLTDSQTSRGSIYLGFIGEFLGKRFLNDFSQADLKLTENKGLEIINHWLLPNSIAHQYGDYLLLVKSNNE